MALPSPFSTEPRACPYRDWPAYQTLGPLVGFALALFALIALGREAVAARDWPEFTTLAMVQCAVYLAAVGFVLTRQGRMRWWLLAIILIAGAAFRIMAATAPPNLTTDAYRYVWDGKIQASGHNPYLVPPADESLQGFRDQEIFPFINRKETARTIYPPTAQIIFLSASRIAEQLWAMQLAMVAFEVLAIWAIFWLLRAYGLPPERVIIYAWHPLPIWEFAAAGHIDAAGMGLLMAAWVAVMARRTALGGGVLAAAVLVKYFPLAVAPALWRRWDWRMIAAFIATAVVLYAPYVYGAGLGVVGSLFEHLGNEGFTGGPGFYLVRLMGWLGLPQPSGTAFAAFAIAVLAAVAAFVTFKPRCRAVEPRDVLLLGGVFLVLTSPPYAWYFAWIIPALCFRLSAPVLHMTLAAMLINMMNLPKEHDLYNKFLVDSVIYLGAIGLAVAIILWGRWRAPQPKE